MYSINITNLKPLIFNIINVIVSNSIIDLLNNKYITHTDIISYDFSLFNNFI